ncbi:hypothetical protein NNJEOMEG_02609 [Fundidesulfovibrio magnetotacticus]|uniref:Uncharacterized protein n=1 Tax=Fundidesulfovibrio magnetotacticus TaxID=2730080 RepID=A0A6V8LQG6_9BACT|nr:hypothetical protein [Fundidesulfovibrio magnetotacticus]GFK94762.1 hypothetical protein NNJEOMEG_02609 [Fundidesulfovibrio magnetotacticus]
MADPTVYGVPATPLGLTLEGEGSTGLQTILDVPSGNGMVIGRLRATSSATGDATLQFVATVNGEDRVIAEAPVPLGAGTDGSSSYVDLLSNLNAGLAYQVGVGETIRVKAKTAVSGGNVYITGIAVPLA